MIPLRLSVPSLAVAAGLLLTGAASPQGGSRAVPDAESIEDVAVLWPEAERAFLLDGPGLLLSRAERERLAELSDEMRGAAIQEFLDADPIPGTPENELRLGIERRRALVLAEFVSLTDDRAKALFLNGSPRRREAVDCGQTFNQLDLWGYGGAAAGEEPDDADYDWLVFYKAAPGKPYRLWLPLDSKRALYNDEMEYFLEQYEELRGRIRGRRFDLQACPLTRLVDQATGVDGLFGFRPGRPSNDELLAWLAPPTDLAAWAREAAVAAPPAGPPELAVADLQLLYPEQIRQRLVTRFLLTVPPGAGLRPVAVGTGDAGGVGEETAEPERPAEPRPPVGDGEEELRLILEGVVEQGGKLFEDFRVRFKLKPPDEGTAIALAFERLLRPDRNFVVRFRLTDEGGGAQVVMSRGFRVPSSPTAVEEPPVPENVMVAMGEELAERRFAGRDSLLLAPPASDVVLGVWRAEALVSGERIVKVIFLVDGEVQLTRTRPPFSAEVRLAQFPREQVIRAEGYDAGDELVAADEVLVNQPRGAFRVRVVEPRRGAALAGTISARAEVTVPPEHAVANVEFVVNEESVARLAGPPWEAAIEVPPGGGMAYLTVRATLDDGTMAEEVRFINAPRYLEEVEVNLVELLTTVTDRSRRPVGDLERGDFEVLEDGRPQEISKFERVSGLSLSVGITIDTSGSMMNSLIEAKQAAIGFLNNVIGPRDKVFAVAFSREPVLLIPPTDDVGAVENAFDDLQSIGWTALHDAIVSSLYYFRGVRGRRALILLSDGDDSASYYPFREALEYAKRSGVVVYTVGLNVGALKVGIRNKLKELAEQTGGRVFFIHTASELSGVYREIEEELRSQYLLAYSSDNSDDKETFRTVEVRVKGGLKARTIAGYYP